MVLKVYGGVGVLYVMFIEVIKIVVVVDVLFGQFLQNYFGLIDVIMFVGIDVQKWYFFVEVLSGKWFGNGFLEKGMKYVFDLKMCVCCDGDDYVVDGMKFYLIGVLFVYYVLVFGFDDV